MKQGEFIWKGAPAYKSDRLRAYQRLLKAKGITKPDDLKLLAAQLIQENGALSESTIGDHGCSIGMIQYNACAHAGISAKRFLQLHPEWKDWHYQLEQMATMVAERYAMYHGNIKQVVTHHNSPAAAKRGVDTAAGYYRSVVSRTALLTSI